jgi:adenosylhomocysteine nucleosidase
MPEIAIFTALGWERRAVTAALGALVPGDRPRTWEGRLGDGTTALVVQAGMGLERAAAAAAAAPPARVLVSCGCAGALAEWLRPGDLVVADRVATLGDGASVPVAGSGLRGWAATQGLRVHAGGVVSSATVLGDARAKRAAAARGLVVDMESAAVARVAAARGVPFLGIRVVLDPAGQMVPEGFDLVDETTGEVRAARAAARLGVRPWTWPAVVRLARQSRIAERRLRRFLGLLSQRGGLGALLPAVPASDGGRAPDAASAH